MNPSLNPVLSQFNPVRTLTRCVLKQNCNIIVPTTHRRGAYRVLVVKPEEKRRRGKSRHRWEDNIKMDLQEVIWGYGMD
jgi:hypothetical protein